MLVELTTALAQGSMWLQPTKSEYTCNPHVEDADRPMLLEDVRIKQKEMEEGFVLLGTRVLLGERVSEAEIRERVGKAWAAFQELRPCHLVLGSRQLGDEPCVEAPFATHGAHPV